MYSVKIFTLLDCGKGSREVFYSGSIHANEWITSTLLMKFVEDYCISYTNNSKLYGYSIDNLFNSVSIKIITIVNHEGFDMVKGNFTKSSSEFKVLLKISLIFLFLVGWKANILRN